MLLEEILGYTGQVTSHALLIFKLKILTLFLSQRLIKGGLQRIEKQPLIPQSKARWGGSCTDLNPAANVLRQLRAAAAPQNPNRVGEFGIIILINPYDREWSHEPGIVN